MAKEVKSEIVSIESITGNKLVNVSEWKKKIQDVVKDNPVIDITDTATYEVGKKARTAVKSVRVEIDKQDKVIASAFSKIRKETMDIRDSLLGEITPHEDLLQAEVDRWEAKKEEERLERERKENERIDGIKAKINELETLGYERINSIKHSSEKLTTNGINDVDFDFEEFDILFEQAKSRLSDYAANHYETLKKQEADKAERDRIEKENALAKKREQLHNVRLTALSAYMAYVSGFDFTALADISQEEFEGIFNKAKAGYDDAEFERQEKEKKDAEEKEALFNIRKSRLEKLGFVFGDGFSHELMNVSLCQEEIREMGIIDFENYISDIEKSIEESKNEQAAQELKEKQEAEKKAKDAKANEKRQKALSTDKKVISVYIDSLEFMGSVPNVVHADSESFLIEIETKLTDFKNQLSNDLNNL